MLINITRRERSGGQKQRAGTAGMNAELLNTLWLCSYFVGSAIGPLALVLEMRRKFTQARCVLSLLNSPDQTNDMYIPCIPVELIVQFISASTVKISVIKMNSKVLPPVLVQSRGFWEICTIEIKIKVGHIFKIFAKTRVICGKNKLFSKCNSL